jgi:hypothetical protein
LRSQLKVLVTVRVTSQARRYSSAAPTGGPWTWELSQEPVDQAAEPGAELEPSRANDGPKTYAEQKADGSSRRAEVSTAPAQVTLNAAATEGN